MNVPPIQPTDPLILFVVRAVLAVFAVIIACGWISKITDRRWGRR